MSVALISKNKKRDRKVARVRKKVCGTGEKPRLCISKTNKHLYAQLINDTTGTVILGVSTVSDMFKKSNEGKIGSRNKRDASILGEIFGTFIKSNNISAVQFDKRWAKYHGILVEFADKVREIAPVF